MHVINKIDFKYPEKIIDKILSARNDAQACDNFNVVYILKHCNDLTQSKYHYAEIKNFLIKKLNVYKKYYYLRIGGFSFYKNKANTHYYGALISRGKNEPDIHGTIMFLWGISLIAQVLNLNDELKFKEHIT